MHHQTHARKMPRIVVTQTDHERLTDLALATLDRSPEVAEELLAEMERAKVVSAASLPANVVRMGSTVSFRTETDQARRVKLVFPADADLEQGRLSILTPVGAALIGLSEGQSIAWTARDGRRHELTVTSVENG
jgi:regulator of nucleoside diphosphate kinase